MGHGVARRTRVAIDRIPMRMKMISHHYQELCILLAQLLLMAQGVNSASQPCLSTPCFLPLADIHTIERPRANDEATATWNEHQLETNELAPSDNDDNYFYDSAGMSREIKDEQEMKEKYEDYSRDIADSQEQRERFREPLVFFISRAPNNRLMQNGCMTSKSKDGRCFERQKEDNRQVYAPLPKRGRYNGFQKWTSAGLPFSVLYHHKQVSRSKPTAGINGMRLGNAQAAAQRSPENGQWVSQTGPVVTNRKQYSTLPHLFVSYGWGPLGK